MKRRFQHDLQHDLRHARPEARDEFVTGLARSVAGRNRSRWRPVTALAIVVVGVAALSAFGGVGYAATAIGSALTSASQTLTLSSQPTINNNTPAQNQYGTGFHGCTPGYWKQTQHFFAWGSIPRTQSYNQTFGVTQAKSGVPNTFSLLDALSTGGGGLAALGRQAAAAYLNSQRPGMNFPYTTAQVIAMVKSAINSGNATTIENTKNTLERANSLEGPLC
jgi:hypothetical protein